MHPSKIGFHTSKADQWQDSMDLHSMANPKPTRTGRRLVPPCGWAGPELGLAMRTEAGPVATPDDPLLSRFSGLGSLLLYQARDFGSCWTLSRGSSHLSSAQQRPFCDPIPSESFNSLCWFVIGCEGGRPFSLSTGEVVPPHSADAMRTVTM
jgi:hypothetical protein